MGSDTTPRRKRRWLRRLLFVAAGLMICLAGFVAWAVLFCIAEPPELDYRPAVRDWAAPATAADGRVHYGDCWFEARPGRSLLYLTGDPYTIGYANARLTADLLENQERQFLGMVREFFPSELALYTMGLVVLVNNRNLPDYVPIEYQQEIRGIAEGSPDHFPQFGPAYHRVLNYHAAHDISHWVWDKPVVGCTAFAARGALTVGGNLWVARNFDFEGGRQFDTNKIIGCVRPQRGHAFLSVSWPGMAGAVTGLNEERLYCSVNGAHSEDRDNIGVPVSLVVRDVLQYASTIDEAVGRIRGASVFVSDSYLVADGKTGEAVVVEKSPGRSGVRRIDGDLLLQANHFECTVFDHDEGAREYRRVGTSLSRHARLTELLEKKETPLGPEAIAAVLRDRRAPGGEEIALGNRSTINGLIATHAVFADLTRGILWVSRGPHQLGAFDAYSIENFGDAAAATVPADPLLADGGYDRLLEARRRVAAAQREWSDEEELASATMDSLRRALELNPNDPEALALLGRGHEAAGRHGEARDAYEAALAARPAFREDRDAIESALKRLR